MISVENDAGEVIVCAKMRFCRNNRVILYNDRDEILKTEVISKLTWAKEKNYVKKTKRDSYGEVPETPRVMDDHERWQRKREAQKRWYEKNKGELLITKQFEYYDKRAKGLCVNCGEVVDREDGVKKAVLCSNCYEKTKQRGVSNDGRKPDNGSVNMPKPSDNAPKV